MAYARGVSAITRVVHNLIMRNGLVSGVKKAQKLGFPDAKIKKAVSALHRKYAQTADISKRTQNIHLPQSPYTKQPLSEYQQQYSGFRGRKAERDAIRHGHWGFDSVDDMMRNNPPGKWSPYAE